MDDDRQVETSKRHRLIKRPTLTHVGERAVSTIGFRVVLVEDHLKEHLTSSDHWCTVECLARVMFQKNTKSNCTLVRKRMRYLFTELLKRNLFLVIEYGERGRSTGCKLHTGADEREKQAAQFQLDRFVARKELNAAKLALAERILHAHGD
jgi:hypothetical protein